MTTNISWAFTQGDQPIRNNLKVAASKDKNFSWLEKILDKTLDEFTNTWLTDNSTKPRNDTFDPSLVEDHLQEASALIDKCIGKRTGIFELEKEAIQSYIQYQLEIKLHNDDLEIAKVQLKANRVQSNAGPTDADINLLATRFSKVNEIRNFRIRLHNEPGNALNFWERISFQREIYADNLRTVLERLYASKIGLEVVFGIDTNPLPATNTPNFLQELVKWLRNTIDLYEASRRNENVYTMYSLLGAEGYVQNIRDQFKNADNCSLKFSLGENHLRMPGKSRLLAVGAAVTFIELDALLGTALKSEEAITKTNFQMRDEYYRRLRRSLSFSMVINFPKQEGGNCSWEKLPLRLEGISAWSVSREATSTDLQLVSNEQIRNCVPIGNWSIDIQNNIMLPYGFYKKSHLYSDAGALLPAEIFALSDLVLGMRIAVQKR